MIYIDVRGPNPLLIDGFTVYVLQNVRRDITVVEAVRLIVEEIDLMELENN